VRTRLRAASGRAAARAARGTPRAENRRPRRGLRRHAERRGVGHRAVRARRRGRRWCASTTTARRRAVDVGVVPCRVPRTRAATWADRSR